MERNDSSDSNPWGAEPSYAQRISSFHAQKDASYDQQMNDVLASPHIPTDELREDPQASSLGDGRKGDAQADSHVDQDDDDDDDFVYSGIDTAGGPSKSTSGDSIVSGDMSSDTYSAKLKDILGSDDGDDGDDDEEDDTAVKAVIDTSVLVRSSAASPSSPTTQRGPILQGDVDSASNTTPRHAEAAPSDDGSSFRYPHPLPNDVSFDTRSASSLQNHQLPHHRLPSHPSSSRIFTPRSTSGTGLSLLRQPSSTISASTPQRPVAYPSLSRLRASVGRAASASLTLPKHIYGESARSSGDIPGTPSSSSSPKKARLPLPFEFTANGKAGAAADPSREDDANRSVLGESSILQRSRQSSFSTTFSGSIVGHNKRRRPRASFPYGGTVNGLQLPTAQTSTSLLSDPASSSLSAHQQSIGQRVVLGGGAEQDSDHQASEPTLKEATYNERDELGRDVVKWSALRRVIADAKSAPDAPEPIPTVLAVAGGLIAIGMQGGKTVVCDFAQEPIASCGHDGRGHGDAVTALAFSSDHSFLGVGHASGNIFLYDLSNPGRAARHVPPVPLSSVKLGKKEGHLSGSAVVHIGFIGLRHTAIVTADNKGLAFYHALGRILGVSSVDTLRLLGKYPQYEHEDELGLGDSKKRNTIFQLSPLPLGPGPHAADDTTFVAMITPTKLVLVGLKPSPRTWYRKLSPSQAEEKPTIVALTEEQAEQEPGCLAWYPASTETDGRRRRQTNPILAFSFGTTLHLVRLVVRKVEQRQDPRAARGANAQGASTMVEEVDPVELTNEDGIEEPDRIVALQWFSPDLLMITTRSGLALFDCRAGKVTERMRGGSASVILAKTIEQRYYDAALLGKPFDPHAEPQEDDVESDETLRPRSWALNHSVRISKGRSFFLTKSDLVVGTLLSWADRLLLYVTSGDFLSAIELATLFHQGKFLGSAVGLPSDPDERTIIVANKLRDLMAASAEYSFSPDRLTDSTHVTADGRGVDRTSLFQGLARVCARACLSLNDLDFLFDTLYDKYEDNGIESIFVGQMEDFIVSGELRSLPIPVVQRLVAFRKDRQEYAQAERIIWHVDPKSLDLDQALSLCLDRRLYDALTYVFNAALEDYVSPIIEMLHPVRRAIGRRRKQQQHGDAASLQEANDDPYAHVRVSDTLDEEEPEAEVDSEERDIEDGYRVFSYLSVILTGNRYPSQEPFEQDEQASKAKSSIYAFIFSGGSMLWPPGPGGKLVLYGLDDDANNDGPRPHGSPDANDGDHEPLYPYLRLLLEFDAEAFLDALDLAFEDGFLDDEDVVGKRLSRQLIVDVLLELASGQPSFPQRVVSGSSTRSDEGLGHAPDTRSPKLPLMARIFAHIFVARNAPKYPQFIHLSSQNVDVLLRFLALPSPHDADAVDMEMGETTHEDRELAAECLLSHYKPRFDDDWLDTFERADFHRILRSAFRQEKKWDRLLGMYLREHLRAGPTQTIEEDEDSVAATGGDAFAHFEETLFNAARKDTPGGDKLQIRLHELLSDHIIDLLDLDPLKTASMMDRFFPTRHEQVLQRLAQLDEKRLLLYLQCFFEPVQVGKATAAEQVSQQQDQTSHLPTAELDWTNDVAEKAASAAIFNADVGRADPEHLPRKDREAFLDLLCRYDPEAVVRNLDAKGASFFDLDRLVQACRSGDTAIDGSRVAQNSDAVLWALDRLGRSKEAFEELDTACSRTADSLVFVATEQSGVDPASSIADELLADIRRCVNVAVQLCIERANAFGGVHESDDEDRVTNEKSVKAEERLDTDEVWYRLLRSLVRLVHDVAHLGAPSPSGSVSHEEYSGSAAVPRPKQLLNGVRDIVQETLSDLISSTAAEAVSFPALFRRLTGSDNTAKVPSGGKASNVDHQAGVAEYYAEIRSVLDGMLSAYHLRSELLAITNKLFDHDTFHQFRRLHAQRRHGWRPAGGTSSRCAGCQVLLVGPKRGTNAAKADTAIGDGQAMLVTSPEADHAAVVEDLRRKTFQPSRSTSFSSSYGGRSAGNALLTPSTPLLQTHHRRAKSPYDGKAAPLASPRVDKGKGVVRSASTEFSHLNGNASSSSAGRRYASEETDTPNEVDGYFGSELGARSAQANGGPSAAMTRSNSTASSVGFSLRINDEPEQRLSLTAEEANGDGGLEDGDGTLTPSRFGQRSESVSAQYAERVTEGGTSFEQQHEEAEEAESKQDERIVVQKTGLVYHESCWLREHPYQPLTS
ncbi:Vacuolar protein sorting-associated protein 8, central domain protein [Kalmanozyma brasiliensis GHG001]|uniref:Vacuolar protein sorting-associated protein 8, central domain protein n=1 Tax=Kalmanozyma brasiliensis (strain GHG001) TaxID=1365824 RepID=UPI002867FFF5|nr:Vacuolar protein sorting-associated protein 8, central domain protein [Kalmanozyma brasiliensis GHG001]EST05200.2 Vacuolar protein sorting-associated protein 8, central domain protein [Kalmanozyma brasiliensis GHG001]